MHTCATARYDDAAAAGGGAFFVRGEDAVGGGGEEVEEGGGEEVVGHCVYLEGGCPVGVVGGPEGGLEFGERGCEDVTWLGGISTCCW